VACLSASKISQSIATTFLCVLQLCKVQFVQNNLNTTNLLLLRKRPTCLTAYLHNSFLADANPKSMRWTIKEALLITPSAALAKIVFVFRVLSYQKYFQQLDQHLDNCSFTLN